MKNLLGRLMGRSFDDLKAIAAAWQIPLSHPQSQRRGDHPLPGDGRKDQHPRHLGNARRRAARLSGLAAGAASIMAFMDELPALLNRPAEEVEALLASLAGLGLVDVEEALVRGNRLVSAGDNLYAWGLRSQAPVSRRRVVSMSGEMSRALGAVLGENNGAAPFEEPLAALLERHRPAHAGEDRRPLAHPRPALYAARRADRGAGDPAGGARDPRAHGPRSGGRSPPPVRLSAEPGRAGRKPRGAGRV